MRYHPSLFVVGVVAFILLAHNQDLRMQGAGALVFLVSAAAFLGCRSGVKQ